MVRSGILWKCCLFAVVCICFSLPTGNHPVKEWEGKLRSWYKNHLSDQLYLHVDKDILLPEETLWFKAYCMNPSPGFLRDTSRFLEVVLADEQGSKLTADLFRIEDQTSSGSLDIPKDARAGIYTLVAYTDMMRRKGVKEVYTRPVRIYRHLPGLYLDADYSAEVYHPGDSVRLRLYARNRKKQALREVPFKYKLETASQTLVRGRGNTGEKGFEDLYFDLPNALALDHPVYLNIEIDHLGHELEERFMVPTSSLKMNLDFFPVGGHRVRGLNSRIAFKATDHQGRPVDVRGYLFDEKNHIVRRFESYFNGMGVIDMENDSGQFLKARLTKPFFTATSYTLPAALDSGYVLDVKENSSNKLKAVVSASSSLHHRPVWLMAHHKGSVYHKEKLIPSRQSLVDLPISSMPVGVITLTLFDNRGIPRAERLVFVNKYKSLRVEVNTEQSYYRTKDSVALSIRVSDHQGRPVSGEVSLSVSNRQRLQDSKNRAGLLAGQILSPEVKGTLWNPDVYFEMESRADSALDHLLLTQGWRRYTWEEIARQPHPDVSKPADQPFLSGIVLNRRGLLARHARVEVFSPVVPLDPSLLMDNLRKKVSKLQLNNPKYFDYLEKKADEHGRFHLNVDEFDRIADTSRIYIRAFKRNGSQRVEIELLDPYEKDLLMRQTPLTHLDWLGTKALFELHQSVAAKQSASAEPRQYSRFDEETVYLEEILVTAPRPLEVPYELKKRGYTQMGVTDEELKHTFMRAENGFLELLYHVTSDFYILGDKIIFRGFKSLIPARESGALFVLDGIPYGENYHVMDDLSLENIKSIKVIRNPGASLIYKTGHAGGLILIETKEYDKSQLRQIKENILVVKGYQVSREFYTPRYSIKQDRLHTMDLRNTLYWNPSLRLDSLGAAQISFYNSDQSMQALCVANILSDGRMGHGKHTYRVYGIEP